MMKVVSILFLIILIIWIVKISYKYSPKIDIVLSGNKKVILLWYYKYYRNGDIKRVYTKLFEI